jgi:DNA-binding PadR family transcriptional regulator
MIDYKNNLLQILERLKNNEFIKVHIDGHNIMGLSKSYYEIINNGI